MNYEDVENKANYVDFNTKIKQMMNSSQNISIDHESQNEMLAKIMEPLINLDYDQQLRLKQQSLRDFCLQLFRDAKLVCTMNHHLFINYLTN